MNTHIKTSFPDLVAAPVGADYSLVQKFSTYLQIVSSFTAQMSAFLQYEKATTAGDFVTPTANTLLQIQSKFTDYDNDFIVAWIKEYNSCVQEIKDIVLTNPTNNFFVELSDSIGLFSNLQPLLTDSVIPVADITVSDYPPPVTYPIQVSGKIRDHAKEVSKALSTITTRHFRQNIVNIQGIYATSTEAHGSNLITDVNALIRAGTLAPMVVQELQNDFEKVFKLVSYYSTINDVVCYNPGSIESNRQLITNLAFSIQNGQTTIQQDLAGAPVRDGISTRGNNVLDVISITPVYTVETQTANLKSPVNASVVKAPNSIPAPLTVSAATQRANIAKVQQPATAKVSAPDVQVGTNPIKKTFSQITPEYNRQPYAFASPSPFGIVSVIKGIRDSICSTYNALRGIGLKLSALTNISFPPRLSLSRINFSFKKAATQLALRVQKELTTRLLALIPPLPTLPNFKAIFKDINKNLFKCNPSNER